MNGPFWDHQILSMIGTLGNRGCRKALSLLAYSHRETTIFKQLIVKRFCIIRHYPITGFASRSLRGRGLHFAVPPRIPMLRSVYLDHHATTPLHPGVLEAMVPYFCDKFGNPSSRHHRWGWEAEEAVEQARLQVAELIGAEARDIIFTGGATEANNLAILGSARAENDKKHIVTSATEHKAVLDPCNELRNCGWRVTTLKPRSDGLLDLNLLNESICSDTLMVSIMAANNEIGVIQAIRDIGALCQQRGVLFHSDAVQAIGKISIDVERDHIDMMSISAHKVYGPKGVGALYVRHRPARIRLAPQILGGGQERGLRSGTLNVPGIVGLGKACALAMQDMNQESLRLTTLRNRMLACLQSELDDVVLNGSLVHRLPNNLHVTFPGVESETLHMELPEIAFSAGSACASATLEPSHVLRAIGVSERLARCSVRFGLGRCNTDEDIEYAAVRLAKVVRGLRGQ